MAAERSSSFHSRSENLDEVDADLLGFMFFSED